MKKFDQALKDLRPQFTPKKDDRTVEGVFNLLKNKVFFNIWVLTVVTLMISFWSIWLSVNIFKLSDKIVDRQNKITELSHLRGSFVSKNDTIVILLPISDYLPLNGELTKLFKETYQQYLFLDNYLYDYSTSTSTKAVDKLLDTMNSEKDYVTYVHPTKIVDRANERVRNLAEELQTLSNEQAGDASFIIILQIINIILVAWTSLVEKIKKKYLKIF